MILKWDKPEQVMATDEWASITADSCPPGVYTPNMSREDMLAWKAKYVGKRGGIKQIEIRKSTQGGTQILIIVSLNGFRLKSLNRAWNKNRDREFPGKNVRISMNGPTALTFEEMEEMSIAIQEAKLILEHTT